MLKVWLPLDGDLRNLGTSDVEVTNNGATVDDAGKIGKCYHFGTSNSYIQIPKEAMTTFTTDCSISFWLKINTWNSSYATFFQAGLGSAPWTHYIFGFLRNSTNSTICFTISNGSSASNASYLTSTIELNKWYHITLTYTTGKCKIYLNGLLDHEYVTSITPAFSSITTITLGCGNSNNYQTDCNINDVRIYDHCLSAAEVKEIAQGLVLHYKLDNGSQEIITNIPSTNVYNYPTFNTSVAGGGWSHWGSSGHSGSYGQNTDKKYIYNKSNTYSHWITEDAGTGKYYLLYQSPAFEGGYRSLQAIIKEENSLPITESICYPGWNARNGGVPNNKWTSIKSLGDGFYYCCCEGISQDGSNDLVGIDVMSGYKIYVSECYLENDVETCSPIFSYSSNIIQDSSGYNHNGTCVNVITSLDTPRYNSCISCSSEHADYTNTITGAHFFYCNMDMPATNAITVTWWGKNIQYGRGGIFETSNVIQTDTTKGSDYNSTAFANWDTIFGIYNGATRVNIYSNFIKDGNWHHHAIIFDGTNVKYYCDSVLKQTSALTGTLPSWKSFCVGLGKAGGVWRQIKQDISDFRIYCTPLLDTDIKLLYNMGMKVDNLGGIHTFEFEEKGGRELLAGVPITTSYSNHTNVYTNYTNGEIKLTGSSSVSTPYIPISPSGKTYYYDLDVSMEANNQIYIGFERYDANKTARSNNATTYIVTNKPSTNLSHQRYRGIVNLSTDGVNPCAFITLRILNDWSGAANRSMTVHKISLREVTTIQQPKLYKTGIFTIDELNEHLKPSFYTNGIVEGTEFIEN